MQFVKVRSGFVMIGKKRHNEKIQIKEISSKGRTWKEITEESEPVEEDDMRPPEEKAKTDAKRSKTVKPGTKSAPKRKADGELKEEEEQMEDLHKVDSQDTFKALLAAFQKQQEQQQVFCRQRPNSSAQRDSRARTQGPTGKGSAGRTSGPTAAALACSGARKPAITANG